MLLHFQFLIFKEKKKKRINSMIYSQVTPGYADDDDDSNDTSSCECGEVDMRGSGVGLQVDWNLMRSIISGVTSKIRADTGLESLKFEDQTLEYLQDLYGRVSLGEFLTVLDQLVEVSACQPNVLTQDSLDPLVRTLVPLSCPVPESELAQVLLLKLWPPEYAFMLHSPIVSPAGSGPTAAVAAAAVAEVYTREAARRAVEAADAAFFNGALCARDVVIKFLGDLYGADPLGFWSVFDQLCTRCANCLAAAVVEPCDVVDTFLACCGSEPPAPLDTTLSPVIAASMPQHPLLPYAYPPHFLKKSAFVRYMQCAPKVAAAQSMVPGSGNCGSGCGGAGAGAGVMPTVAGTSSASASASASPSGSRSPSPATQSVGNVVVVVGTDGEQQQARDNSSNTYLSDPCRFMRLRKEECGDLDAFYPYTWRAALLIFDEIERVVNVSNKRRICFDEKHKQNLRARWEKDPRGFFSIIDQIFEKLVQTNWDTVRDEARYVQSLVARFEPQTVVSRLVQSYVTPPEVAAAKMAA